MIAWASWQNCVETKVHLAFLFARRFLVQLSRRSSSFIAATRCCLESRIRAIRGLRHVSMLEKTFLICVTLFFGPGCPVRTHQRRRHSLNVRGDQRAIWCFCEIPRMLLRATGAAGEEETPGTSSAFGRGTAAAASPHKATGEANEASL